jgi:hypothetical protein
MLGLEQLVLDKHVLLIGGGDMESQYPHIQHDHFLCRILHYEENIKEIEQATSIFTKTHKPYNFMFLNGRARAHRKYLWERFRQLGLLDHALYTVLDSRPTPSRHFTLIQNDVDLMTTTTPLKWLPREYEVEQFRNTHIASSNQERVFVKNELFDNQWGEIYLQAEPYTDTYFSVVTETVFDYPYSFRTEKIAKPLAIGHPWIVASNVGFYRDMRNLGFRTFNGIIDESFTLLIIIKLAWIALSKLLLTYANKICRLFSQPAKISVNTISSTYNKYPPKSSHNSLTDFSTLLSNTNRE